MFVPSSEACSVVPNSRTPDLPAIAASQAEVRAIDQARENANADWLGLLTRDWRSLADLGPRVAFQARNGPTDINRASVVSGIVVSDPSGRGRHGPSSPGGSGGSGSGGSGSGAPGGGVSVISPGNPDGSNPIAGGEARRRRPRFGNGTDTGSVRGSGAGDRGTSGAGGGAGSGLTQDDIDFSQRFNLRPMVQTYTGPRPPQGSVLSLTVGGSNPALPVGPGTYPAATPDPRFGYRSSDCLTPTGISMTPWGEPAYPPGVSVDGSSSSGNGWGVGGTLLGLLALAGLAYFADKNDKKQGRTRV